MNISTEGKAPLVRSLNQACALKKAVLYFIKRCEHHMQSVTRQNLLCDSRIYRPMRSKSHT